jgi:hypothetical protein
VNITEFLLARIKEDEDLALKATQGRWKLWGMLVMADPSGTSNVDDCIDVAQTYFRDEQGKPRTWDASHIARWDPQRVLKECEAKLRIVNMYIYLGSRDLTDNPTKAGMFATLGEVVLDLASTYSDHPDYWQGWAP